MKIKINFIILLLFFCSINMEILSEETWPCEFFNDKRSQCAKIEELPLEIFQQKIIPCDRYETAGLNIQDYASSVTSYIGKLNEKKVYYIIYRAKNAQFNNNYKMIVIEKNPDTYKPVFCSFYFEGGFLMSQNPYIVSDKNILVYESQLPGNGGYMNRFYLYFPSRFSVPKIIDTNIIYDIAKRLLPKEYSAGFREISFDIKTLKLRFNVYNDKDPSCCPTGGQFEGQFVITKEGDLKPLSYKYDKP